MRKVGLTILLILVVLLASVTTVKAAEQSATFSLTTTNTDVKVGDEVTVTFSINNINGFSNIKSVVAKKVYDSSIFEYVSTTGQNGWELKGDSSNIVLRNESGASTGAIAVLKFKVLKEVENTRIQLSELDASGDGGDVYYEDNNVNAPYVEFKVTTNTPVDDGPTDEPSNEPSDNTNEIVNKVENNVDVSNTTNTQKNPSNTNKVVNNDKTTATTNKIPQTGEPYAVVLLVAATVIIAGIFYAKYKTYENKMK